MTLARAHGIVRAMGHDPVTTRHVREAIRRLTEEFSGVLPAAAVEQCAWETLDDFRDARVAEFVPVLVHRYARERLRALVA